MGGEEPKMKCVIFGGADISDYSTVRNSLPKEAHYTIAADRGYLHCLRLGITPDILLGDLDSLGGSERFPQDLKLLRAPCDKDDTDTLLAVKYASENGISRDFLIFGGTGGRFGHTFANIQTLSFLSANGMSGTVFGEEYVIRDLVPELGRQVFNVGGDTEYISVFSLSESAEVILDGLKYSGRIKLDRRFPLGVSNEPRGENFSAEVLSGEIIIIEEKRR